MKRSVWKRFTRALALVLVAELAVSQTPPTTHWHDGGLEHRMLGFMTDYLDLTGAQQAQVSEIFATEKPNVLPLIEQLAQTRRALLQLEQSGTFDETKVRAVASEQAQTISELTVEKVKIKSQIFNILTPEQKTKAQKIVDRREARFRQHLLGEQQAPANQQ